MKSFIAALVIGVMAISANAQSKNLIGASALIGTMQQGVEGSSEITLLANEDGTVEVSTTKMFFIPKTEAKVVSDERAADGSLVLDIGGYNLSITNRMDGLTSYVLTVGDQDIVLAEQMLN